MNVTNITEFDLVTTADLISELDKRADRVIVLMETNTIDPIRPGSNFMIHNNNGFCSREHIIFCLMSHVKHLVDECMGDCENDS